MLLAVPLAMVLLRGNPNKAEIIAAAKNSDWAVARTDRVNVRREPSSIDGRDQAHP
jgi:hypothetical protein